MRMAVFSFRHVPVTMARAMVQCSKIWLLRKKMQETLSKIKKNITKKK